MTVAYIFIDLMLALFCGECAVYFDVTVFDIFLLDFYETRYTPSLLVDSGLPNYVDIWLQDHMTTTFYPSEGKRRGS